MTDNLILWRMGRDFYFWDHLKFNGSLRVQPAKFLIIARIGGASWEFRHRKLQVHWHVVRWKSFENKFRRRVFKPQFFVTRGSTFQVLRWKHSLAIWIYTEIREFFSDQNRLVEVCHIESRLTKSRDCLMTESAEGWLGRGSDGHILPLFKLTAL